MVGPEPVPMSQEALEELREQLGDEPSTKIDREAFLRIPRPLHGRWLDRCHREDVNPDDMAAMMLERALRRERPLTAEETEEK